ncbi:hypothetical protein [Kaistella palustris]|uniref:hypothetical protein n=1 Tax=Kaistella palustris TaxID=493376 RepID=UPI00040D726B|nr:hypothetical protein [Kaistella palustris]
MKKYFTVMLLAIFGLIAFSCNDRNDDVVVNDQDTYPKMTDVTGTFNSGNGYSITQGITIGSGDVVLVYRNINSNTSASAVWQLLPKTEYLDGGRELDYNFLFDTSTIEVYTEANFDQATMTSAEANKYLNSQRFRLVLVPASQGKNANVNYSDYESVIKYYNLPDRK